MGRDALLRGNNRLAGDPSHKYRIKNDEKKTNFLLSTYLFLLLPQGQHNANTITKIKNTRIPGDIHKTDHIENISLSTSVLYD